MVAKRLARLGAFYLQQAWFNACNLFVLVNKKWNKAMIAPSNSAPYSVLIVIGEKLFHKMISQMFVAINSEIPEPRPYPFWSNSSNKSTITPAIDSWATMSMDLITPSSSTCPYMPESKYASASPTVITRPKSFCAD